MNKDYYLNKAKYLEGKTISEALPNLKAEYSDNRRITKSVFANFVEKEYFNLDLNSYSRPDFEDVSLELKTSGIHFINSKGIYNAKERLVLTQIDYYDVIEQEHWMDNKHLKKIFNILFVLYLYEKAPKKFEDFQIVHSFIWEPSNKQIDWMQRDYEVIRNKILKGHIISERDTDFLGNCPRHGGGYNKHNPSLSKSGAIAKHPRRDFAERRAFCIKQRAFDHIIASSLNLEVRSVKGSIGLFKHDYPNFK